MTFILETVDAIIDGNEFGFAVIEATCMGIFTLEVVLRVLSCPSWSKFLTDFFNWIDLFAILPFYLELLLPNASGASSFGVVRVVRLVRVARVVKISRYSNTVRVFSTAMISSLRPLSMLFFLVGIGTIMFSSAIYYAEYEADGCRVDGWEDVDRVTEGYGQLRCLDKNRGGWTKLSNNGTFEFDPAGGTSAVADDANASPMVVRCACVDPNPFTSIPAAFWWSIVTASTVGYGDHYPVKPMGKVVAAINMISGIIILALPVTVISSRFAAVLREIQQERMLQELDALDRNMDGVVDEEELAVMIQHIAAVAGDLPKELIPTARELLEKYDADASGALDPNEVAAMKRDMMRLLGHDPGSMMSSSESGESSDEENGDEDAGPLLEGQSFNGRVSLSTQLEDGLPSTAAIASPQGQVKQAMQSHDADLVNSTTASPEGTVGFKTDTTQDTGHPILDQIANDLQSKHDGPNEFAVSTEDKPKQSALAPSVQGTPHRSIAAIVPVVEAPDASSRMVHDDRDSIASPKGGQVSEDCLRRMGEPASGAGSQTD